MVAAPAAAAEISVLSAGAVEPGLRPAILAFERSSGTSIALSFATAPQIRERIGSGALPDIVIAPPALLDEMTARLMPETVTIGKVGIGVAVRAGAPRPDVTSVERLRQALSEAERVVYNRASTGLFLEAQLRRWGLEEALAGKTVRYPDGAGVMEHLLAGSGREIGFGAITEIRLFESRGLVLVGPMPPSAQNHTTYVARLTEAGSRNASARALLRHLGEPAARERFEQAGIEPAR